MPGVKYITREEYTVLTPCQETRKFTSQSKAKKWTSLHIKRCACCKGAKMTESVRDYTVRVSNQLQVENERAQQNLHRDTNRVIFNLLNHAER